jgi:hypothetical protein
MPSFDDGRRWLSFDDPYEERTWMFDLTFLTSSWQCIYGRGCPGIETRPAPEAQRGCCNHGAWLSDDADLARVTARAGDLGRDEWQFRDEARRRGGAFFRDRKGDWRTRRVDGACIFLNRPGFGAGAGCALHSAALARQERSIDWKPEVCWQAPLRREDHETVTGHIYSMVRAWHVRDWGGDRADFGWWCVHEPEAFGAPEPVYASLGAELVEICGQVVYDELVRRIGEVAGAAADSDGRSRPVVLPDPTVR